MSRALGLLLLKADESSRGIGFKRSQHVCGHSSETFRNVLLLQSFSMRCTIIFEPSLTFYVRVRGTQASASEKALPKDDFILCSFYLLLQIFLSTADKGSLGADIRPCDLERYARSIQTLKRLYAELLRSSKYLKWSTFPMTCRLGKTSECRGVSRQASYVFFANVLKRYIRCLICSKTAAIARVPYVYG